MNAFKNTNNNKMLATTLQSKTPSAKFNCSDRFRIAWLGSLSLITESNLSRFSQPCTLLTSLTLHPRFAHVHMNPQRKYRPLISQSASTYMMSQPLTWILCNPGQPQPACPRCVRYSCNAIAWGCPSSHRPQSQD